MATLLGTRVEETAFSLAVARSTSYIIPTVDQLFDAGLTIDQVNQSLFLNWQDVKANAIFPYPLTNENLYYNVSFLWPQLDCTGLLLDMAHECNPQTCSLLFGTFMYLPNLAANIFFITFFSLCLIVNIPLAIRQRTWSYMVGMVLGVLCECLGYTGRILISQNDFEFKRFYLYIICLTIGPAFLSFSIYTCLARIVVVYGREYSRLKPKTYTYVFVTCDFISLVLQAAGGGLAATAADISHAQTGINVMIAGLAFQVFSMTIFIGACTEFALRVRKYYRHNDIDVDRFDRSHRFRGFLVALAVALVTIYVRCVFRVAELQEGFRSRLANSETIFLVLEGGMISIATLALTVSHPSIVFGDRWQGFSEKAHSKMVVATPRADLRSERAK